MKGLRKKKTIESTLDPLFYKVCSFLNIYIQSCKKLEKKKIFLISLKQGFDVGFPTVLKSVYTGINPVLPLEGFKPQYR